MRYTRRRRAAACFNGEQYERSEFRKTCPCTEEDYECDYGYERATESGPCVAVMAISSAPPADCRGTYNVSNGYRLVAGDTCDPSKGIDRLPTVKRCPGLFSGGAAEVSPSGWVVLLLLLLLLGVLGVVTLRHRSEHTGPSSPSISLHLPPSPSISLHLVTLRHRSEHTGLFSMVPMDRTSCLLCLFGVPGNSITR